MSWHRFALAELPATPWKNGGGTTREVAAWPPGASVQDFDWRISVATIAADGPFSAFAGIDRVITLLAGDGVLLQGAGWSHALDEALAPFAFAGDEPVQATLLGGASEDFNVMTRRGRCQAQVLVVRTAQPIAMDAGTAGLLLAAQGDWQWQPQGNTAPIALPAGHGMWWAASKTQGRLVPLEGQKQSLAALQVTFSSQIGHTSVSINEV